MIDGKEVEVLHGDSYRKRLAMVQHLFEKVQEMQVEACQTILWNFYIFLKLLQMKCWPLLEWCFLVAESYDWEPLYNK